MNHELARELLWREYPTDQRGTYSRQFWAHRNTGDPTDQYDLQHRLHEAPELTLEQLGEKPGRRRRRWFSSSRATWSAAIPACW